MKREIGVYWNPSRLNTESSVPRETGLTRYPSTPLLNASRLSSAVARPVRANILARWWNAGTWTGMGDDDFDVEGKPVVTLVVLDGGGSSRRSASTSRIARVASCPFMIGIEMSIKMTLELAPCNC